MNRNGQSRRRQTASSQTIIVGPQDDTQTTVSGGRRCAFPPYACLRLDLPVGVFRLRSTNGNPLKSTCIDASCASTTDRSVGLERCPRTIYISPYETCFAGTLCTTPSV